MKLKRLANDEEDDKKWKKKSIALKDTRNKDMDLVPFGNQKRMFPLHEGTINDER